MTDEKERFLLSMKDKLGEYDYDRLQTIIIQETCYYISFIEALEKADRNGEVS